MKRALLFAAVVLVLPSLAMAHVVGRRLSLRIW